MKEQILNSENWRFWTPVTISALCFVAIIIGGFARPVAVNLVVVAACVLAIGLVGCILTGLRERRIRQGSSNELGKK